MWVAVIAAVSAILSPVVNGIISRRSPVTRADAAERFTNIAARVAEENERMAKELSSLKSSVLALIILLDRVSCDSDQHQEIHQQLQIVKKRVYGILD